MGCSALVLPRYLCTLYHKKEIEEHSTAKLVFPRVRACNMRGVHIRVHLKPYFSNKEGEQTYRINKRTTVFV